MEYFAVYAPSVEDVDSKDFVFEDRDKALSAWKANKDSRFKAFNNLEDAQKFAKNGKSDVNIISRQDSSSLIDKLSVLKSPPPNQLPIQRNVEKSNFPAPKSQDLVKFRKEIEQNNVQKVYEMICLNPRYLVGSGDTPSILKEGPRYNALHIAAMNKHPKMIKLILQTVEKAEFIKLLYGINDDENIREMSKSLLESYLNTPDKSRNETALHFAAKLGAKDVIEVLLSYPTCKMMKNNEGLYPKDIICMRCPDATPELKNAINELLAERFYVPVLRADDGTVQPVIGEPFTPSEMPNFNSDPLSPKMEVKALAGPMSSEQAQSFRKRWKTPPRLIPSATNNLNISFSPKSSAISSPLLSPRMTKSMTEVISSTPKLKKKLFDDHFEDAEDDDFERVYLSNLDEMNDKNGNNKYTVLTAREEDEFKEIFEDLMEEKAQRERNKSNFHKFKAYRNNNPDAYISDQTPIKGKNDSNSNHIHQNFNAYNSGDSLFCNPPSNPGSAQITFLDDSGSVYSTENIHESLSFKEKNIRLTDTSKGLEKIGRGLAHEYNVGWKEYWEFLGKIIDIRSKEGLECFEGYLKKKEKNEELNELSPVQQRLSDSFGLSSICAGLYSMDINDELMEKKENETKREPKNGLASPTISRSPLMEMLSNKRQSSNDLPLPNPFTCIEQSCRTFAKRLAGLLESESIQDQNSYEKTLLTEINKLMTSINSYKSDSRFSSINFQKVHSRYSFLLVWFLKKNNSDVKYLRNLVPLMSKVYALASSQFTLPDSKDLIKCHAMCISAFTKDYIEHQEKIFNPENVNSENSCIDAWNGPDIVECKCSFGVNLSSYSKLNRPNRREIRKRLYSGQRNIDIWSARTATDEVDDESEESFLSCDSELSSDEEYFTPPTSPTRLITDTDTDDDINMFEESLEHLEDEKEYSLYINGDEPSKTDTDVFTALGEDFSIDPAKYPFVHKWFNAMKSKSSMNFLQKHRSMNLFRIFTPKLKMKS